MNHISDSGSNSSGDIGIRNGSNNGSNDVSNNGSNDGGNDGSSDGCRGGNRNGSNRKSVEPPMASYVDASAQLAEYLALDLRRSSPIAQDLFQRVGSEAERTELPLSDLVGSVPANLTPAMDAWYRDSFSRVRGAAYRALLHMFSHPGVSDLRDGFLPEARLATLDERYQSDKLALYRGQRESNRASDDEIQMLQQQLRRDEPDYENRVRRRGREAKPLNKPLYLFILLVVLFGAEAALNVESFQALPWATPAIAWGATIIVGLAIGLAAHYHGTLLKQHAFHFGVDVDDARRGPAWQMFAGGTLALSLSLSFVFYARSAFFAAYMQASSGFGQAADSPGFLWTVGGSLIGNMLVYLVATMVAYLMHDSDPDMIDLHARIEAARARMAQRKQGMEAQRQRGLAQLQALHKKHVDETRRAASHMLSHAALRPALEKFHQLQAKDSEVAALLFSYRQSLVKALGANAKRVKFMAACDDPYTECQELGVGEFERLPIALKYHEEQ